MHPILFRRIYREMTFSENNELFTNMLSCFSQFQQKSFSAITGGNHSKPCLLKLASAIFYQIFIFSPNDNPSKTMKNVFYFI